MNLLQPIQVGKTTLKNRIMFPPLTTGYEAKDGSITPQSQAFYERLAKGGTSYIVIGDVAPIPTFSPVPKLCDDSQIESYRKLADAVHAHGAKIAVQIFHPEYDTENVTELFRKGDFAGLRAKMKYDMTHYIDEVSPETLHSIIERMCLCAKRAEKAGIDGIQIHGDRLVGAFSSTILNHRTDEYGGSLENRTRFALELVRALRKAVPTMMIDYKLATVTPNRGKGGVIADEAVIFAKWLEEAGVDMLHVAQANHTGNMADTIPPMGVQPYAFFADIAGRVKENVSIPVSTVGRIVSPELAESILESGKADIIGLGRPLLADPDWAVKLNQYQLNQAEGMILNKEMMPNIRQCVMCNKGCTDQIQNRHFLGCVLNAENGYELTRQITPAEEKKHVVIVGGGPAGLEAARVAAKKGHQVTLFEAKTTLGGQLQLAKMPPRKEELERGIAYLVREVRDLGVDIRCGQAVNQEDILALNPRVVLAAVGAENMRLPISGAEKSRVCSAWDVLEGKTVLYGKTAVIGGGMVGCETAEYLAARGCQVSIIEMREKIAEGESNTILPTMMEEFQKYQVAVYTSHKVLSIEEQAVKCEKEDGSVTEIPYDFVVMAAGAKPVAFATDKLVENGISVVSIGDFQKVSDIENAIKTGYDAANAI